MATIVTVHGTAATGPEEGKTWWQKGSEFEQHIRELVEGADGDLNFQPHIWDGANSKFQEEPEQQDCTRLRGNWRARARSTA